MKNQDFTIIVDTREQTPWELRDFVTAKLKLDVGDYSVQGLENIFCIERKRNVSEFAHNITESRYENFVQRLSSIPHAFLLLEFNLEDVMKYPIGSTVPKHLWSKIKISPQFILKHIIELQTNHNIAVMFCGNAHNAQKLAAQICEKMHKTKRPPTEVSECQK
jgi:ERCC4-type nuclease